ncbi:MAG: hypothetical protein H6730_18735 [Deltaproteobacteria bacterium]|nr:hypothetical protein [Deltaproteobacteria bacterium]
MTRLVVIGLVVSLGLFGCEDGAGLLGVQDASVDAGGVGADGGADAGSEARLVLPPETWLVNVDNVHGRLFLHAYGLGLLVLHLDSGELELLTADPAPYLWLLASPLGEGAVFREPHRIVVDPGPGRARIVVEGEMFVVVGDVVLAADPALHRVDPRTGDVRRLADDASALSTVAGRTEVALVHDVRGNVTASYFAETDALVSDIGPRALPLRRGALVLTSSASSRLITADDTKDLPFWSLAGPDLVCGMRGATTRLQQIDGLPEWLEVEVEHPLIGAFPSALGCVYIDAEEVLTWVGLDGMKQPLIAPGTLYGGHFGDGLMIFLTQPPALITNERGLQWLSVPEDFELPETQLLGFVREGSLRLAGHKIVSLDPVRLRPVQADIDLATGQVHPRTMDGLTLGLEQPGSSRWLGATDRELGLGAGPTTPYAVNTATGERRALSSVPVPLPVNFGPGSLDSVITVGDRAVYFEQVFDGEEVVELRPVIVDL